VVIAVIRALVWPVPATLPHRSRRSPTKDWVTLSQEGLEPIAEGRFVVHTSGRIRSRCRGCRAFLIEAGQAFGTGHHATTSGCLAMLDRLSARSSQPSSTWHRHRPARLAARHLWPESGGGRRPTSTRARSS